MKNAKHLTAEDFSSYFYVDEESGLLMNKASNKPVAKKDKDGYLIAKVGQKCFKAHRVIYALIHGECKEGYVVDHINGNKSDNRISNLRLITQQNNTASRRKLNSNSSTGQIGVGFHKLTGKWFAEIKVNNKSKWLGLHLNIEGAIHARKKAEIELLGEFKTDIQESAHILRVDK